MKMKPLLCIIIALNTGCHTLEINNDAIKAEEVGSVITTPTSTKRWGYSKSEFSVTRTVCGDDPWSSVTYRESAGDVGTTFLTNFVGGVGLMITVGMGIAACGMPSGMTVCILTGTIAGFGGLTAATSTISHVSLFGETTTVDWRCVENGKQR